MNRWIGTLFDPLHRDETVTALLTTDDFADRQLERERELQDRVAAAQVAMGRLQRALDAGCDPAELREQ